MSVTLRYSSSSKYQTFYSPSPVSLAAASVRRPTSKGEFSSRERRNSELDQSERSHLLEVARKRASSKNLDHQDKEKILDRVRREYQQKKNLEESKNANILMRVRLEENRAISQKKEQLENLHHLRTQKKMDQSNFLNAIRASAKPRVPVVLPKEIDALYSRYSDANFKLDSNIPIFRSVAQRDSTRQQPKPREIRQEPAISKQRDPEVISEQLQDLPLTESVTLSDTKASRDLLQRVSQLLSQAQTQSQPKQATLTSDNQGDLGYPTASCTAPPQETPGTPQKTQKPLAK